MKPSIFYFYFPKRNVIPQKSLYVHVLLIRHVANERKKWSEEKQAAMECVRWQKKWARSRVHLRRGECGGLQTDHFINERVSLATRCLARRRPRCRLPPPEAVAVVRAYRQRAAAE